MKRYEVYFRKGIKFFIPYDNEFPALLHIYVRHIKQPEDAIEVFFNGTTTWNPKRRRFETYTTETGLYWL